MLLRYVSAHVQGTRIVRSPVQCGPHFMVRNRAQGNEVTSLNVVLQEPFSQPCQ